MKKQLLTIIILNYILFDLSAQSQVSGDFLSYIDTKISSLPGAGTDVFAVPTVSEMTDWESAILAIHNGQYTQAHSTLLGIGYQLVEYTDNVSGDVYYMAEKQNGSSNHWGMYIFNTNPLRQRLVIQAPHPKHDTNSGAQASYVFRETGARALFISGTHRCNSPHLTSCSGTTTSCGSSGKFRISDNPHNTNTAFHSATKVLFNAISHSVYVQLHGFGKDPSDPYVILSNGTTIQPTDTDYLALIRDELLIEDPVLTFKIAHLDSWTRLIGTTNVQGHLINGAQDPCIDTSPSNNSRFVHIEQERYRLRENSNGWTKMSNALSRVFPVDVGLPQVSLMINEIHADPASGLTGDANGDGVRSSSEDEFVEIVNTGISPADLSGFKLFDEVKLRHVFAAGTTLPAGKGLVVFGGGTPTGTFGNSTVETASTGSLGITNGGDLVELQNHVGEIIDTYTYGSEGGSNQSINRSPDLDEGAMSLHASIPASNGTFYSPGTQLDGSEFSAPVIALLINEIHADPASDISGDANGDGVRSSSADEFIEIVNVGALAADISGFQIYDANPSITSKHTFPSGTIVPAGQAIVIFGGGTPTGSFGGSVVQTASTGALGVTNTNETIEIRDLENNVLDSYSYTSEANINQSLTRSPDLEAGPMTAHSAIPASQGALYSPGLQLDGTIFRNCTTIDQEAFEVGWGIWNDGGVDADRINNGAYAQSGVYAIKLVDNTASSVITTDIIDASSYETLEVSFSYITESMDNSNEDFWLQVSTDGGGNFTTVAEWNLNDEFVNGIRYAETVVISGITWTNQTQLRFRCDASGNWDFVYLDDILIAGCGMSGLASRTIQTVEGASHQPSETIDEWVIYPNPARDFLYVERPDAIGHTVQISLLNLGGQLIKQEHYVAIEGTRIQMSLAEIPNGIYLVQYVVDGMMKHTKKVVVSKF